MTAEGTAFRAVVRGRVQGVGFRYSSVDTAVSLRLVGWVRNRIDGSVEVFAQGDPEALAGFRAWLGHGPRAARVDGVMVEPASPEPGLRGFTVR